MVKVLSDSLAVEEDGAESSGFLYVDAVDTHEGVDDGLASVGDDGVAHGVGHDINAHSAFETDAVGVLTGFDGYSEEWHSCS